MRTINGKNGEERIGMDVFGILALCCFALILMLGSCGRGAGLSPTGTYVSHESGEYSISRDTLLILSLGDADNYQLIRRSGFQRIRDGKLQPEEVKVQEYRGKYDLESMVIRLEGAYKQVRFLAGGKGLLLAKREYHKIMQAGED